MTPRLSSHDVAVVGAGPAGSIAAAAFARAGAHVLWLEANPHAAERFAGEWLHPPAVRILRELGLSQEHEPDVIAGKGFVVFPEDGSDPIRLPYTSEEPAIAFEHARFVGRLREAVRAMPGVSYVPNARVLGAEGGKLRLGEGDDVLVGRVVGADGRGSSLRRALGEPLEPGGGRMAGLALHDVELPFESHGHVFVGGPGPALLYRIDPTRARLCLDVPEVMGSTTADLWAAFAHVFPPKVRAAFREALETRPVQWAQVKVTPRRFFGRGEVALIGDAVGTVHPLCAAGMTIAMSDAVAVAKEPDLASYAERRRRESDVAELLSDALHRVLVRKDPVTTEIRQAMYRSWRTNPDERARTMDILAGDIIAGPEFGAAFVRVALSAARSLALASRGPRDGAKRLLELGSWGRYPLDALRGPAARAPRSVRRPIPVSRAPLAPNAAEAPRSRVKPPVLGENGLPNGEAWDYCVEALERVSRSFAKPIGFLPPRLRIAVTCGYLVCRIADTVEDASGLDESARDALYAILLDVLEHEAPPTRFTRAAASLPGTDHERELAMSLDRVLAILGTTPPGMQKTVRKWAAEMTRGMQIYSHRGKAGDGLFAPVAMSDLERYCYFVAGTVGHMLTDLFIEELEVGPTRAAALRQYAESFGIGLQLVNILKDVTDDRSRGVSFVPRQLAEARGLDLHSLVEPARRREAHEAVAPLFELARTHLDRALEYVVTLPSDDARVRLFCLLPLWMAARTLVLARGNDAMFVPGEPVKIDRDEVERLAVDCTTRVADDASLREAYRALWGRSPSSPSRRAGVEERTS